MSNNIIFYFLFHFKAPFHFHFPNNLHSIGFPQLCLNFPPFIHLIRHFSLFASKAPHSLHNAKLLREVQFDCLILDHNKYDNKHINKIHIQVNVQSHRSFHKYNTVRHLDPNILHLNEYLQLRFVYHLKESHCMRLCNMDNDWKTLKIQWCILNKTNGYRVTFLSFFIFYCSDQSNIWDILVFLWNFICFKFSLYW